MEKFELKVDLDTPYIKVIHFLGAAGFGYFIAAGAFNYFFEGNIYWMNSLTGIALSLFFAFFPGVAKKQSLTINEDGIQTHHYKFHWSERKEISWENISAIGVDKSRIHIKNKVGSSEKIALPLHTKEQANNLKAYLKQVTA